MFSLLAASLPPRTSPQARLLALQCVLRCDRGGCVTLPRGLVHGLDLGPTGPLWQQLLDARWVYTVAETCEGFRTQLNDPLTGLPGRGPRARAAHWASVQSASTSVRDAGAAARLASVMLLAHTEPALGNGAADSHTLARMCGMALHELLATTRGLLDTGVLDSCSFVSGEELMWSWPKQPAHRKASPVDPQRHHGE
ncbi:hypothetical protein [Streptomyces hydrogenans]|jgi:hypothetical protein|uniref:hypothetical protein n=1 Tax=Streptomyces hydrogenans TaxID=1873719 RepID=UPI0035D5A812